VKYLPVLLLVVFIVGLVYFSSRTRRRQAMAEERRREDIRVGTKVMTTSGLYGTVVSINEDDSVQLSIAAGVEVKWTLAALRDLDSLPGRYRKPGGAIGAGQPSLGPDDAPGGLPDLSKRADPSENRQGGDSAV
jgi:preprotein translocase subunit YajC